MRTGHTSWNRALGVAAAALILAFPGIARAQQLSGPEVWAANCARCHRPQPTNKYDARQWAIVVTHMALAARLTPDEERAVREFLAGGAARSETPSPAAPAGSILLASSGGSVPVQAAHTPAAEKLFEGQCAPCHGARGRGDGPVAAVLQPKPADLTDLEFLSKRTDEELEASIISGKGAMPAFANTLSEDDVRLLVVHIRWLGEQEKEKEHK